MPSTTIPGAAFAMVALLGSTALADPLEVDLSGYQEGEGLAARLEGDSLTLEWQGAGDESMRLTMVNEGGAPMIRELTLREGATAPGRPWPRMPPSSSPSSRAIA